MWRVFDSRASSSSSVSADLVAQYSQSDHLKDYLLDGSVNFYDPFEEDASHNGSFI